LKLPYLRASYTKSVGPIKFCIEIYLPRLLFFKTLRRLGAIFETPCIILHFLHRVTRFFTCVQSNAPIQLQLGNLAIAIKNEPVGRKLKVVNIISSADKACIRYLCEGIFLNLAFDYD
jgi:hypothetical protein